ncbi:MAG: GTPase HflX [Candidatus Marinimicrobia bacterium]|nr:GTPase HflX [Candidatus Neomarinimicrobiota bacterium]
MDRTEIRKSENAFLVGVSHGDQTTEVVKEHLSELKMLAETAGAKVVGQITQKLRKINPQYFIGKGKALQIIEQAKILNVKLIIFDDELNPGQVKNFLRLAKNIKIIDRNGLILDIFRKHAQTREAKTQVELAQLEYILPRLTRQWSHLERQMGGIGTLAGMGESQIEVDRRLIRQRISKLKKNLTYIEKERQTQSKRRKDEYRVALVGYTNAGKSTLMRAFSGEDVLIQDQLFATLDTTIRKVQLDKYHSILLSDTVGFIRKLPHDLVASFRSTLLEVLESNLILVVLDAASDQVSEHLKTIGEVLKELGAERYEALTVLNKIDLISENGKMNYLKRKYPDAIMVSAKDQLRLDRLIAEMIKSMNADYETVEITFSYEQGKELAKAQENVEVLERHYQNDSIRLKIKGRRNRVKQIINQYQ